MYKIKSFFITSNIKIYLQLVKVNASLCTIPTTGERCYLSLIRERLSDQRATCRSLLTDFFWRIQRMS